VLELLRTKRRRSTKTTLKKVREIYVNGIPTVFDEVRWGCTWWWYIYEGWNFNSGNYLFTTDTK